MIIPQTNEQFEFLLALHKESRKQPHQITHADEEAILKMQGKACRVTHTSYKGIVVGPNRSTGAFYNGAQFPILVKITEVNAPGYEQAIGMTYEYRLEQVVLEE